jgi:hypothetical protein
MKKIVRLTESDLVRLVKRVINEGQQSFDVVPLSTQNAGTGMIMDGKGRNILNQVSTFSTNEIVLNAKEGINYEVGETITATITLNPLWMVTGEILKKSDNIQVNFDPKNKKVTLAFKIPNSRSLPFNEVTLRCNNIDKGELTISVHLPKSNIIPPSGQMATNESYRKR